LIFTEPIIQQILALASGCNVGKNFKGHIQANLSDDLD